MGKRMISWGKLKSECVEKYKEYHRHVWPELEALYKQSGIISISCFLNGIDLLVYCEVDEEVYTRCQKSLDANEVQVKWQKLMKELAKPNFKSVEFREVYRME